MTTDHNEAMRLAESCDGNVLHQPAASLLRKLAEQIKGLWDQHHRDSAELRALCAARDAAKETVRKQAERIAELELQPAFAQLASDLAVKLADTEAERDTLREEVEAMGKAISDFCDGNRWAVDAWKNQSYIKPLFDIDTARKATP